ncbi:MAG: DUF2202 domain-containing protein [Gammaproteobacteria bacterium]|nr:DUF2202 domain-containing protein [Gammaproteobacteria bacterium]
MIMKAKLMITGTLFGSILACSPMVLAGGSATLKGSSNQNVASTDLSSVEADDLRFMREEEKLARDVYLTMDEYWGKQTRVFANIAESEQSHTSTVNYILDKFDVEDPVTNDSIGVFTNQDLQTLYNNLTDSGKQSFISALYVGALIEEKDMKDILAAINRTDERAIIIAYSNLLDGSKSHLRAFVNVIESEGMVYEAQILDAEEVELILND